MKELHNYVNGGEVYAYENTPLHHKIRRTKEMMGDTGGDNPDTLKAG